MEVAKRFVPTARGPDCHCHKCTDTCFADYAGHFIGAEDCEFFIHDDTGRYCVSTVGDYRPDGVRREIGYQRFYETMVFDKQSKESRWSEVDGNGYMTEPEAKTGHAELLAKYRALKALEGKT